ncbi:MAG: TetR/AcrR family transcriptional regulator [Candidatus Methylacidiphilaceae bacterium]
MKKTGLGRSAEAAAAAKTKGRPYHHGALRRALLDAALLFLRKRDPSGLTLRALSAQVGVSAAAPYRHFSNKEALLAAVAEEGFRQMTQEMRVAEAKAAGVRERLRILGLAYIRFAKAHPEHFRIMFGREAVVYERDPSASEAAKAAFSVLVDAVRDGQNAGLIQEGDPRSQALAAWAMVHGLAALAVDGRIAGSAEEIEPALGYFLDGLMPSRKEHCGGD